MVVCAPANPKNRFEVYRFFNGLSAEAKEGLDRRRTRGPLVKTFLVEHVSRRGEGRPKPPEEIFKRLGATVRTLDDSFMSLTFPVRDKDANLVLPKVTGFLEKYDERFFAYYTCEGSEDAQRRVADWIKQPDLDFAWFSSPLLQVIWNKDVSHRGDDRFCKLVFKHESIYDMPSDFSASAETEDESEEETDEDADKETVDDIETSFQDRPEVERRKSSFQMGDRIKGIRDSLSKLQAIYAPLYVLHALRIPSNIGRGGHDLYQTGRITNRSDTFEDHRNTVRYLYRIYKSILDTTEDRAWPETSTALPFRAGMKGVPLIIKFKETLLESTLNRWVQKAFQKNGPFKLWGHPIRLGPTKYHVYGADRHLWQPINMEITSKQMVAMLPQGTCGNTFHRLVANIQQYVCPNIQAWVGSTSFEDLVSNWPKRAGGFNED